MFSVFPTDNCGKKIEVKALPTDQSSTHTGDGTTFSSERAIDRDGSTCANTEQNRRNTDEFWTIDLKKLYNISCFCIYNKGEANNNTKMTNAMIVIGKR